MIVQQYKAKQQTENALEHYTISPYAKKKKNCLLGAVKFTSLSTRSFTKASAMALVGLLTC